MKKLLAPFCLFIFLYACSDNASPNKIIAKDKMYNVLIDMHLADASLDYMATSYNQDSMLINAKAKYDYIFSKYGIDSAIFSESLAYYSKNKPAEIVKVYQNVIDSLDRFRDKLSKSDTAFEIPVQTIFPDTIYYHINLPFVIDSNLLKNSMKEDKIKTDTLNKKSISASLDTAKSVENKLRKK